jgi:hypothetical protein
VINVARNGKHHFRIEIVNENEAKTVYWEMVHKYSAKCYSIDVAYWEIIGHSVNWKG